MPIKAILFDIDGTLVDSNDQHVLAWAEVFRRQGVTIELQAIHDQIGKGADMMVPTLLPGSDDAIVEQMGKLHGEIFKSEYLDAIRPFSGAHDLLARVHRSGRRVVLASSASTEELEHYTLLLRAGYLISATTSADDVENTKPAPDIFSIALKKLAPLGPQEVLVVGDTPYDVEAAGKCGIATLALRSGKFPDEVLRDAGALTIYDDVAELLSDFDASPLAG